MKDWANDERASEEAFGRHDEAVQLRAWAHQAKPEGTEQRLAKSLEK